MKTVLVVDDERLIRWALCEALRKEFLVYSAASADEALNLMGRVPTDAVVTDLKMAGMNGIEFISFLRQNHPKARIFAVSAYASDPVLKHLLAEGVTAVLPKPFEVGHVLELLRHHVGNGAAAPQSA
jgi:two-component system nitrogen regulation response regulator GlnG